MFEGGIGGFIDNIVNGVRCAHADVMYQISRTKRKKIERECAIGEVLNREQEETKNTEQAI